MINEKINKWLITSYAMSNKGYPRLFNCVCECGTKSIKRKADIFKSLGCIKCNITKSAKIEEIIGKKFGKWIVIKEAFHDKPNKYYECRCDCGNVNRVKGSALRDGKSTCCIKCRTTTHKLSGSKIYAVWNQMLQRCNNPRDSNYKNYGLRGIKVCDSWHTFINFFNDMGDQPTGKQIDRINNDGNYEIVNCRWVTPKENNRNKRNKS